MHYTTLENIYLFSGSRKKKAKSSNQNATCNPVQVHFTCMYIHYKLYLLLYCSTNEMASQDKREINMMGTVQIGVDQFMEKSQFESL